MEQILLNPVVRSVAVYEKPLNTGAVKAYDTRVLFLLSGGLTLDVEGQKRLKLAPGNFCLIPPATEYRMKCDFAKFVYITFDFTTEHPEEEPIPPVPSADFAPELVHRWDGAAPLDVFRFIEDLNSERDNLLTMAKLFCGATGSYRARVSAMLKLLLLRVTEEFDDGALPSRLTMALDDYIRENASDDLSNTEVGAIFGYHPFYISQMLKKRQGITLRQYIISYRLKVARDMLRYTKKTTAEIAEETGFTDASYFTKSFKNAYQTTPKDYRNLFKEEKL